MEQFKIHERDNVAVQRKAEGELLAGHKYALCDLQPGDEVIKYGHPIGRVTQPIAKGEHVHSHNLASGLSGLLEYDYQPTHPVIPAQKERFFDGYLRKDGRAGIRNEIFIVPTVGCVNAVAQAIEREAQSLVGGSIEGVAAFCHPYGCSQLGGDHENTRSALLGLVNHPNAAGVLVLGLGCENNRLDVFRELLGDYDAERVKFLSCQDAGDEIGDGVRLIGEICEAAAGDKRQRLGASMLCAGLKCGGSDGFSGITANPLVGAFSDLLIGQGGSVILTEVPEMFGAEALLMNRCQSEAVFDSAVSMINGFKQYYMDAGQPVYENPSPGNKQGGITTLEEKALGCTQKAGSAPVVGVLRYGEPISAGPGLRLLNSPGNDLVSASALSVSGAHFVLFTTGRGTPFGGPVPTVKLASNDGIFERKRDWFDFSAGGLIEGESMEECAERLMDYVLEMASGRIRTAAEKRGARDFAIFKTGVTL